MDKKSKVAISNNGHFGNQVFFSLVQGLWLTRFRIGNAFAFLAKCCFCSAANIAFLQWLWRTLREKYISVQGIDAAFSATQTLFSFSSWEMLSKVKVGSLLALLTW